MRKPPSLRSNNGALQLRVRLEGQDHFINRLGRWDDPIAVAKAQAISAEIWRDYREGRLDWTYANPASNNCPLKTIVVCGAAVTVVTNLKNDSQD